MMNSTMMILNQLQDLNMSSSSHHEANVDETEVCQRLVDDILMKQQPDTQFCELFEQQQSSLIHQARHQGLTNLEKDENGTFTSRHNTVTAPSGKRGSIFDHLSHHRENITLLGVLREAAIIVPSKDEPQNEQWQQHSTFASIYKKGKRTSSIFDYLEEHRARMSQSSLPSRTSEWDNDCHHHHHPFDATIPEEEYNGIDELIFDIEL